MNQELETFIREHIPVAEAESYRKDLQRRIDVKEEALARGEAVELEYDEALYFNLDAFQEGEFESFEYGLDAQEQPLGGE